MLVHAGRYDRFWNSVASGSWEGETLQAIASILKGSQGTYIDIGAWIGPTVLLAAKLANRVIAYEPDPVAAEELRLNLGLNAMGNVEVRQIALLDRDQVMPLGPGSSGAEMGDSTSTLIAADGACHVQVRDVHVEVANTPEFRECSLLKIDVEGAEYVLVPRLAPYLAEVAPGLLLSTHGPKITEGRGGFASLARYLVKRARLFRALRNYKHFYVVSGRRPRPKHWRRISVLGRVGELFKFGNREYLLTNEPMTLRPRAAD